jgi:hypothetical protein
MKSQGEKEIERPEIEPVERIDIHKIWEKGLKEPVKNKSKLTGIIEESLTGKDEWIKYEIEGILNENEEFFDFLSLNDDFQVRENYHTNKLNFY